MKKNKSQKLLVILSVIVLAVAVAIFVVGMQKPGDVQLQDDNMQIAYIQEDTEPTEVPAVPLSTDYIVLSYPAELEKDVNVSYEDMKDGQRITFTTDFTGEELELFHFSISASGDDGFPLGTLEDTQAGDLVVCMNVKEYTDSNWKPEEFNKLNAMQERVNDIIIQFYEDPRFVSNN